MTNHRNELHCCVEVALKHVKELKSPLHLYSLVNPCFEGFNYTSSQILGYLNRVFNTERQGQMKFTYCGTGDQTYNACSAKTDQGNIAYIAFWIMVLMIALIANGLVCIVICKSRTLRRDVNNYFIVSLAISDLLVAVFIIPFRIQFASHNKNFCASEYICRLYLTSEIVFFIASITSLLGITIDRYLALCRSFDYKQIMTKRKAKFTLIFIWTYSVVLGILANFDWDSMSTEGIAVQDNICFAKNKVFTIVMFIVVFYIPLFVVIFIYARIYRLAISHARHIASTTVKERKMECPNHPTRRRSLLPATNFGLQLEIKAATRFFIVCGVFFLCWLPLSIVSMISQWCPECFHRLTSWPHIIFVEVLPVLYSMTNPFIYSFMKPSFRDMFWKTAKKMCRRNELIFRTNNHSKRTQVKMILADSNVSSATV